MTIHRAKYLIATAALSIATLLPGGTAAAAVAPSTVPKVVGLSLGAAEDSLRDAGYDYTIVNPDLVQVDERAVVVIRQQTQDTGDADGGFVVALTRGVVMPDLLGRTLAAAERIAARRTIAVRTSPASAAGDWTVKFQNPRAGAYMMFGDEAGVALSEPVAPSPGLVPVPDLIGSTENEAAALVKGAGLNYKERILKNGKQPGRVVSQRPQPGELVEPATTVTADVRRVPAAQPTPPPTPPPTAVLPTPPPTPPAVVRTVPVPDELAASASNWPSWLVPLLLATAVLAVGAAGRFQRRRGPKPRVSPVPLVHASGRLTPGAPQLQEAGPAHRIRINARLDRGRQYLQEKDDEHQ